jgi:hypothetical protein
LQNWKMMNVLPRIVLPWIRRDSKQALDTHHQCP